MIAGVALAGMPPFGLFASEVLITIGAYAARPRVAYLFLALLTLAFATLLYHVFRMALGEPAEAGRAVGARSRALLSVAIVINLAALGAIGLQIPPAFAVLLDAIVRVFGER